MDGSSLSPSSLFIYVKVTTCQSPSKSTAKSLARKPWSDLNHGRYQSQRPAPQLWSRLLHVWALLQHSTSIHDKDLPISRTHFYSYVMQCLIRDWVPQSPDNKQIWGELERTDLMSIQRRTFAWSVRGSGTTLVLKFSGNILTLWEPAANSGQKICFMDIIIVYRCYMEELRGHPFLTD